MQGKVKWFSDARGFGFIECEGKPDVFVHHTSIQAEGYRSLKEGEFVSFEVGDDGKGPKAISVIKVGDTSSSELAGV